MRRCKAVSKIISMLESCDPGSLLAHRLLLALCIFSDKEADRSAMIEVRGIEAMQRCLDPTVKRPEVWRPPYSWLVGFDSIL